MTVSRLHLAWQAAILAGGGAEVRQRLTLLALAEAHRLAATTAPGDTEVEIHHLRRSLDCFDAPDTRHALARAYVLNGDPAAALEELEVLLDQRPQPPAAWVDYMQLLVAAGRRRDAHAFLDRCRRLTARIEFRDADILGRLEATLEGGVPAHA